MTQVITPQAIWSLKRTASRATARAERYQKEKRRLQVRVRYLERSQQALRRKCVRLKLAAFKAAVSPPPP